MTEFYDKDVAERLRAHTSGLSKRYHIIACHVLWREFCQVAASSPNTFTFDLLEQGLHNSPDDLRAAVQAAVDRSPPCDAVLLGYGLCSMGIVGIMARTAPVVCVRAHDCITFLLGSKERYQRYFNEHPGTYWYSPGWIDDTPMPGKGRSDAIAAAYAEKYGAENAAYLMEIEQGWMKKYTNAAYVDIGSGDGAAYKEYTKICASYLGWDFDDLAGDASLMKRFVDGAWGDDDFCIVSPGERIVATHDALIIGTEKTP
ncbi:MAG: DUF1638 domain-containing protein [Spirochaetota bacterium]